MRLRIFTLMALFVACPCGPLCAQEQADDPQAVMREMQAKIFQNMQARGIDPQAFFAEIGQKMRDGSMDPADIQKLMIDKGIIDQQMVTKMQTSMQSSMMNGIRQQLGSTDDEWKILLPRLQKVINLSMNADQTGLGRGLSSFMGGISGPSPAAKAMNELRAAVKDTRTSPESLARKLQTWRDAREKALAELTAAQKELVEVLTARQEAVLMNMDWLQ